MTAATFRFLFLRRIQNQVRKAESPMSKTPPPAAPPMIGPRGTFFCIDLLVVDEVPPDGEVVEAGCVYVTVVTGAAREISVDSEVCARYTVEANFVVSHPKLKYVLVGSNTKVQVPQ